ncbi:MAG: hypothetical protein JWR72_3134 [Flavisolibacter sp.]|nr:hypothetical protein [Flavisolibacter sp.]
MKLYLCIACCLLSLISSSQKVVDVDKTSGTAGNLFYAVGGEPYVNVKFVRLVSGSPYFKDQWMKGAATSAAGILFKSGIVKLDIMDNEVHFLDVAEKEMIVGLPLKDITLTDTLTGKSYHFVNTTYGFNYPSVKKGWYLQAASGAAGLYQYFIKQLRENRPFNSATTEQTIVTLEEFYILYKSNLVRVKKPKDVPLILSDKKAELEVYLKKLDAQKASNSEQLVALVTYYNSLLE